MYTHPEYGETPKCKTYGDVVHDGHVQVSTPSAKVTFVVCTGNFHDETRECKEGFDLHVFCLWSKVNKRNVE